MTKRKKALLKVLQNPKHVRFKDLEVMLLELGFTMRQQSSSHAIFVSGRHRITVPKPHKTPFVKEVYIRKEVIPTLAAMGYLEEDYDVR